MRIDRYFPPHYRIVFCRGLSYSYPGSTEPALKNINLSISAGETLAIVGLNGSGTVASTFPI